MGSAADTRRGRQVWQVLAVVVVAVVLAGAAVVDLRVEVWLTTLSAVTAVAVSLGPTTPRRRRRGLLPTRPLAGRPAPVSRRGAGPHPLRARR